MIPSIVDQLGPDTVSRWERSAPKRIAEGDTLLAADQCLIAIYLYGYAIEMRLKAAYFRMLRYGPHVEVDADARNRAEVRARQSGLMSGAPHDLAGWARLLVSDRQRLMRDPFEQKFGLEVVKRAVLVYDHHWRPRMRYRGTDVKKATALVVRSAATWFEEHYRRL
jgi:hypothetical protein